MARLKLRDLAAVAGIALTVAVLAALPAADGLRGLALDLTYPLRHAVFGPQATPAQSHVAVIAIDEETYRREPFAGMPQAAWPPLLAPVINAVAAEAHVIGLDVIWSTSLDGLQRGFERDFLLSLRQAARENKLVLGKVQHSKEPILPHPGQQMAAGGAANIRALNLFEDSDGIIRRLPLAFDTADGQEAGFAYELARRGGLARATFATDAAGNLAPNFNTGPGDIPTYSLADLYACAQAGRSDYFREHFAGRIVILATVLDVEDRRLTAKRLAAAPDGANAPPRCIHPVLPLQPVARDSIPGAYIHAAAINSLLDATELRDWPRGAVFVAALALALAAGLLVFRLRLLFGLGGVALLALLLPLIAALLLRHSVAMPWLNFVAALAVMTAGTIAYRFTVAERDRRQVARAFALYLPPALVDRMLGSDSLPQLGGEERPVTVLFSDIASFTAISESCDPQSLVLGLNEYFSAMTAIIEAHGGFVDKYIGDAIVAIFGAPLDDVHHAEQAVRAALQMQALLQREPQRFAIAGHALRIRIGLNSGPALIGNIGSPRRFNYTAMGDTVNLAARLEGANKRYGTGILASADCIRAAGDGILSRPLDTVRVVGRSQPAAVFEPLAPREAATEMQKQQAESFAAAIAALQRQDIAAARAALQALPESDAAARLLQARIDGLAPGAAWPAVTDLTEK